MEIVDSRGYRHPKKGFKIDLIVWKLGISDILKSVISLFKIDLIVWKFVATA